nr:hypothetical protein [Aminithiophilus ramosus]
MGQARAVDEKRLGGLAGMSLEEGRRVPVAGAEAEKGRGRQSPGLVDGPAGEGGGRGVEVRHVSPLVDGDDGVPDALQRRLETGLGLLQGVAGADAFRDVPVEGQNAHDASAVEDGNGRRQDVDGRSVLGVARRRNLDGTAREDRLGVGDGFAVARGSAGDEVIEEPARRLLGVAEEAAEGRVGPEDDLVAVADQGGLGEAVEEVLEAEVDPGGDFLHGDPQA